MSKAPAIIAWLWIAFAVCWLILAQFNKKATRTACRAAWGLRLVMLAAVLAVTLARRHGVAGLFTSIGRTPWLRVGADGRWLGVVLCLAGLGLAFWARLHIGRNWGMPMSLRQGHELVTSGPYAYIRHPIYAGIVLAMVGSALAVGVVWLLLFALYFAYFIVSARTEEKMMLAQFPDTYPAYRRCTKMLIPFVF